MTDSRPRDGRLSKARTAFLIPVNALSGLALVLVFLEAFRCAMIRFDHPDDLSTFAITRDLIIGALAAAATLVFWISHRLLRSRPWRPAVRHGLAFALAAFLMIGGGLLGCHTHQITMRGGDVSNEFRVWWSGD